MRKSARRGILLMLAPLCGLCGCAKQDPPPGNRMTVIASIGPLGDFARQVGGSRVDVRVMLPPAASPHTYLPSPAQMTALSNARLLVLNGLNLEYWADKAIDAADNPQLIVVRTSDGLEAIDDAEHSGHDHHQGNPHVWLSPANAMRQVESIRKALAKADPAHAAEYRQNAASYLAKLTNLERDIRQATSRFSQKSFVAFHPAWVYFARDYGLEQKAVIEKQPGAEPSPSDVARIVETIRSARVRAVFAEPQFPTKAAEVIAEEAGVGVLLLDPIGKPPRFDYITMMRENLRTMTEAME